MNKNGYMVLLGTSDFDHNYHNIPYNRVYVVYTSESYCKWSTLNTK